VKDYLADALSSRTGPMALVAEMLRATFAGPPKLEESWNAKAARIVAEHRKDHPRVIIVEVRKRSPA